jgi:hypothetical protein
MPWLSKQLNESAYSAYIALKCLKLMYSADFQKKPNKGGHFKGKMGGSKKMGHLNFRHFGAL